MRWRRGALSGYLPENLNARGPSATREHFSPVYNLFTIPHFPDRTLLIKLHLYFDYFHMVTL